MRIIGGTARGREFFTPQGLTTRPTLSRVREALFNTLQFEMAGAKILDLFSGSGGLALEALSRGAAGAVCNDADPECASLIKKNAEKLGFSRKIRVLNLDYHQAMRLLSQQGERFDIVFLDAPYATDYAKDACAALLSYDMINKSGVISVEHLSGAAWFPPEGLFVRRFKRYGECSLSLCQRQGPQRGE